MCKPTGYSLYIFSENIFASAAKMPMCLLNSSRIMSQN